MEFTQYESGAERATTKRVELNVQEARALIKGEPIDLQAYLNEWAEKMANEKLKTFPSSRTTEGKHDFVVSDIRTFERGEFSIDLREFRAARLTHKFNVQILRPAIVSDFEIQTRGRVLAFAPVSIEGGDINVSLVASV